MEVRTPHWRCRKRSVDLAINALRTAEQKARDRGLIAWFLRHDACHPADLGKTVDTIAARVEPGHVRAWRVALTRL